jgi:pyruvate,water dikinase
VQEFDADRLPSLRCEMMVTLSMPERALAESRRPWSGAGLVRSEFIFSGWVRIHPMALCHPQRLPAEVQGTINRLCRGYTSKQDYFVDQASQAVATIASAFWPRPVILRLSDLKTHEYAKLVGGERFEPPEANPVLGFRGAARCLDPEYRPAFELELAALARVRNEMGLRNLQLMIPFCRTPDEGERVLERMGAAGLVQGEDGLQVWVMAELPSNVILADQFAQLFDGLSIGSNDLTQLTLGVDRDNARVGEAFDELDSAMMASYQRLIEAARGAGKKVSFCGQAASDDAMFAATLAEMGVDSLSVAPDAFHSTLRSLAPDRPV